MPVDPQMQAVIERVAKSALPPFYTVSADEARRLYKETRAVLSPPVPEVDAVRDFAASGPAGPLAAKSRTASTSGTGGLRTARVSLYSRRASSALTV